MTKIDRYDLKEKIADGGMGEIYLAYDGKIGRDVALKLLALDKNREEGYTERFKREARIFALLEHPHIVQLYDYGIERESGRPYLVMQYMPGQTLRDRVDDLTPAAVWQIIDDIGGAIAAVHRSKIVHRDIKPSNVLFDLGGNAYLSDFGIAQQEDATTRLTGGNVLGTPQYMSPEQCQPGELITPASDQYSFAALIFLMLTKEPLYRGNSMQVMYQHLHDPPPLQHLIELEYPIRVVQALRIALSKDPQDRFSSIEAFMAALTSGQFESKILTLSTEIQEGGTAGRSGLPTSTSTLMSMGNPLRVDGVAWSTIMVGLLMAMLLFSLAAWVISAANGGEFIYGDGVTLATNAAAVTEEDEESPEFIDLPGSLLSYPNSLRQEIVAQDDLLILSLDETLPTTFLIESAGETVVVKNRFNAEARLQGAGLIGITHSDDLLEINCFEGACRLIGDVEGSEPLVAGQKSRVGSRGIPSLPSEVDWGPFAELAPALTDRLMLVKPTLDSGTPTLIPATLTKTPLPTATLEPALLDLTNTPTTTSTVTHTPEPTLTQTLTPTSLPTWTPVLLFPTSTPVDPRDLDGDGVLHDPSNGFYDLCQDGVGNPGTCGCPADRIPAACGGGGGGGGSSSSTATPQSLP